MKLDVFLKLTISALLASSAMWAQTATTGQIVGRVTDPSSAVISGATVKLSSQAGLHRETVTSADGSYLFTLVPPGVYNVEIAAAGFKSGTVKSFEVRITETVTLNVPLQIGATGESVTVEGGSTLVQTTAPVLGRVIDGQTLSELPLATRNYTQVLGLSPGTATYLSR